MVRHYPFAGTVMNKNENGRCNRRDPFITGISRKGKPFDDDEWDKENIKPLLDAHYLCDRPGKPHAIADVLMMLDEEKGGYAQISVHGGRKGKRTSRKLGPTQLRLIQEWLDVKMNEGGEAFQRLLLKAQEVKDLMDFDAEVLEAIANKEKTVVQQIMESEDEVLASNKAQTQKIESEADRIIGTVGQASKPADGGGDGGVEQPSQDAGRYYEWCLSDAALHQERPEWMAEVSPTRNTNSGDAHLALVPGVNPQPADARAKHPEAVDSGTSGGGANPAAKKACVAAVVISSGGPHFAATPKKNSKQRC